MDFYDFASALYVGFFCLCVGYLIGAKAGRAQGRYEARLMGLRRRRPLQVNVDWDFAERCFKNSGYKIVRDDRMLH